MNRDSHLRALPKHGAALFDGPCQAVGEIDFFADPAGAELSPGCAEAISASLAAAVIAGISRRQPRVVFNVYSGDAPALLLHFLRERACELVIARPYRSVDPDADTSPLFHERMTVVVGSNHRFAGRRRIRRVELAQERWLLSRSELMEGSPVSTVFASGVSTRQPALTARVRLATRITAAPAARVARLESADLHPDGERIG